MFSQRPHHHVYLLLSQTYTSLYLPSNSEATNGIVIATERKIPSILVDEESLQKIVMLTDNIGCVYAGMGPDFRVLYKRVSPFKLSTPILHTFSVFLTSPFYIH